MESIQIKSANGENINIEEKWDEKDPISHVLDRPGTWVGSIIAELMDYPLYIPSQNIIKIINNVAYNAGLLKLIDEVLSNSVDEFRSATALFKISEIDVTVNSDGYVRIRDNGGIPVQMHKKTKLLLPEMLFGHMMTSSNYDDKVNREGVGTNGLGAKLTNIYSKNFQVKTSDGKNSVVIQWKNNMREIVNKDLEKYPEVGFELIPTKSHGTEVSFNIDLSRFEGLDEIPVSMIRVIHRRCIDACATNNGLKINFTSSAVEGKLDSSWQFDNFMDYVKLWLTPELSKELMIFNNKKDTIVIVPESLGFNFGFVNSGICSEGTHIKKLEKQLKTKILELCVKNDMELITERDILNRLSLFVNITLYNPAYESQTKKVLAHKLDKYQLNFSKDFLNSLETSPIMTSLKEFYEIKYAEVKKKELRKLNATIKSTKTKKLIMPQTKSVDNELWLFEGTSAANGFRKSRQLNQAAYLLRGKIKNTFNLKRDQIIENLELREILAALGLQFNNPKHNVANLKFAKIVIASDMDHDGHHICGLLIAFFAKHFPELFRIGAIYRALSPIVIASKGKERNYFYSLENYDLWEHKTKNINNYEIIYTKGLGGLTDADYRVMLREQKLLKFSLLNSDDVEAITAWFTKSTDMRKQILLEDAGELNED